ncbi:Gfo/Idh/MocA family oxidoreductase [Peterkaempfera bronchialis]|uniref:Gfo/Idh/MocA-like oxidoreductase N-terminal domain-containing protein n=1 Tax=Peterkaempfera bronchialis TaxID=2126346 RepID=A0A345STB3_9ACTN|nr:Gfo/Idh/MocA family oxidoreductase [Peterkaempfera bronchialis]AXI76968.1 hypothetical protein C7M71_005380 [Peterkaempfera bronchialis]
MSANVLLIGVGPHARLNHLPALAQAQDSGLAGTVTGIDLPHVAARPLTYGTPDRPRTLPIVAVTPFPASQQQLPAAVRAVLDDVADREAITAAVVATEPSLHLPYTLWALGRGLSVLLDKPLTVRPAASTDPAAAAAIATDYQTLHHAYRQARQQYPGLAVSVLSQRRWHPAITRARELIAEVAEQTNCPITSIQSSHADGQWRMPDELLSQPYHGFDRGYGKAAHSGYHLFDTMPWLLAAAERPGKELDEVELHALAARPADTLAQLTVLDHERLIPGLAARNHLPQAELQRRTADFGEVDVFVHLALRSGGRTLTLGSINLAHHTFSQRHTLDPSPTDLYKGNGRVGQESHIIQQGPFQALHIHALQSLHAPDPAIDPTEIGGADHVAVHVFRNNRLRPDWRRHTTLRFADLVRDDLAPTQRAARTQAVTEFLAYLAGRIPRTSLRSDLATHYRPAQLMAGTYLSLAHRHTGTGQGDETLDFRPRAAQSGAAEPMAVVCR